MKRKLIIYATVFGLALISQSAKGQTFVGAELPLIDGTPDGWSGIPIMYGHELPAGEVVETVHYYAAEGRAFDVEEELYTVTPLIVRQEDGSTDEGEGFFSIFEIGPAHIPTESGENEFAWGSMAIPDDGHLYHPAAIQWLDAADNANGGVIAFAEGGEGMHYFDVDTFDFVPDEELGDLEEGFEFDGFGHSSPFGGRAYQLTYEMGAGVVENPGDFNGDGEFDAADLNELAAAIRDASDDGKYDLDGGGSVGREDHTAWVKEIRKTWVGDSNFDGEFSSTDFVVVFGAGLYESGQDAQWESGDWDGDGKFDSSDFVAAFSDGGYEKGPVAVNAVPEPTGMLYAAFGTASLLYLRRRKTN